MFFFFFQAEDGIRDRTVTGVQTCALPICRRRAAGQDSRARCTWAGLVPADLPAERRDQVGAPRSRAAAPARPDGAARRRDRGARAGCASGSVHRRGSGCPGRAHRRNHRLDLPRREALQLAARRSRQPAAEADRPARRACRSRPGDRGRRVSTHAEAHAGHPPEAHQSSRVDARTLGMFLFIASEIMLFGSFFTAYFFVRVAKGTPWPTPGHELPVFVAGINTIILVTSSFTMHWALQAIKRGNRAGLKAGLTLTFLLGLTFLLTQIREYSRLGFAPYTDAFGTIFYCLTGLHGAHVFVGLTLLLAATIRSYRGHYTADAHWGVEIPGIYWHFVDVMWIVVYTTVYIL